MNTALIVLAILAILAGGTAEVHPNGQDVWVELGTPARMHIYYQTSSGAFDINWGPQEPGWYVFEDFAEYDLTIDRIVYTADDDISIRSGPLHRRYFPLLEAP